MGTERPSIVDAGLAVVLVVVAAASIMLMATVVGLIQTGT